MSVSRWSSVPMCLMANLAAFDALPNVVVLCLDVLAPVVEDRVLAELDR